MKNLWEKHYEKDCDALFVGEYPMRNGTRLFKIDENVMLYLTKRGEVCGLYIEYYKSDFVKKFQKLK